MSGPHTPLSGRLATIKPWHYVAVIGAISSGLLLLPWLSQGGAHKKVKDDAETAAAMEENGGDRWQPPVFPVVTQPAIYNPPTSHDLRTDPPATHPPEKKLVTTPNVALPGNGQRTDISDYRMFGTATQPQPTPASTATAQPPPGGQQAAPAAGSIDAMLQPSSSPGYSATRMTDDWAIIPKGTVMGCHDVTAMTTQMGGYVKAKLNHDVRGHDGSTVLLDRNSDITGEIAHGLSGGQDRAFVLWTEVLTPSPNSIRITLNSPAADELGEAGLPGDINDHKWPRIKSALLLSGIQSIFQGVGNGLGAALANRGSNSGSNGINLNLSSFQNNGSSLASDLLQNSIAIPDTLHRDQALPCSIFTSGDLSFKNVYALKLRHNQ